jgi:hypothetical protein
VLEEVFHKRALRRQRWRSADVQITSAVRAQSAALEESGRSFHGINITWEDWVAAWGSGQSGHHATAIRKDAISRSSHFDLPQRVAKAVAEAQQANGIIKALPWTVEELHDVQKHKADSSKREHLRAWLCSDEGKAWLQKRATLLVGDDECDV